MVKTHGKAEEFQSSAIRDCPARRIVVEFRCLVSKEADETIFPPGGLCPAGRLAETRGCSLPFGWRAQGASLRPEGFGSALPCGSEIRRVELRECPCGKGGHERGAGNPERIRQRTHACVFGFVRKRPTLRKRPNMWDASRVRSRGVSSIPCFLPGAWSCL